MLRHCLAALSFAACLVPYGCARKPETIDYSTRIGIAVRLPARVCLAIHNSKLLIGSTLTLIAPADPPASTHAEVSEREATPCPGAKSDNEMSTYNLKVIGDNPDANTPLIALDARLPSVGAAHSFHACASAEGVHLTAWDGAKPLEGRRLWHQYYYLGRGLEPNCTLPETAQ